MVSTKKTGEVKLAWVRQNGRYRCDLLGHRYEIMRGIVFSWVLSRDGVGIGNAATLAEAKQLGVRAAQRDNGVEPKPSPCDLTDLAGLVWPWIVALVPSSGRVPDRWYVLDTRARVAVPCASQEEATVECKRRNAGGFEGDNHASQEPPP